ncbi:MAG: hypothetical protein JKY50_00470 [Oleispira sp.]|nr:hypothetical protein [Oleispira sp.]
MNILNQANHMVKRLAQFNPELVIASTGSCYVHLTGCKVKYIRVANHTGHKEKPKTWQLRCDVSSSRKGTNRIYTDFGRMITDLIREAK